jgi:transposase
MRHLYARASEGRVGLRTRAPKPRQEHHALGESMNLEGMGPCLAVEGATMKLLFEAYVERVLAPSLRPWRGVVMANLGVHRGDRVRELIDARGCSLLYLPPYSPDFSPIEEVFSKLKALLRKAKARTREALLEAIGGAFLEVVSKKDARGWFGHCGYLPGAQPS